MAEGLRLSALLPDRLDRVGELAEKTLCENEDIGGMGLAWNYVAGERQGALKTALDCDLLEVLAKGWAQARLLAEYADPKRHPPGERAVIELGKHDLTRELHPVIAITIGSCPCVELRFTFAVAAHFGGVQLAVMDGHIVGGSPGDAWATAQLSYQGVPLYPESESRKVAIPGEFRFAAPGIAIPRLG